MFITSTTNEFTMGSSHVVFLNIFFYGDVTQKRHWQKNLPVGFNGLTCKVLNQTLPHLQGSCRNTSRWCLQNYIKNGWVLTSELTSKWRTFKKTHSNFTLISLLIVEVLNQTSPNLHESCRNTSRWCLQNYMKNGWVLTSELTSKWKTFENTHSNFTLISLIIFEVLNQTSPNLQGSCRNTSRWGLQNYMENG